MRWLRWLRRIVAWLALHPLVAAGLALALVVVVTMAPLLLGGGWLVHSDIWTSDLNNHNAPLRAYLGGELRRGRFPLWVPGLYTGLPLLAHGEAAPMSPLTWLCYGLLPHAPATNLSVALHTWLAGFGTVLLARQLGARTLAGTVAGVSFMLCGFMVEHVKHMNMHHAAAWLPWMAWLVDRLRARPGGRAALALGAVGALQLTEGHPQIAYIGLFVLVPLLVCRGLGRGPGWRRGALGRWVAVAAWGTLAVLVTAALSGAYLAATLELTARSVRVLAPHLDPFEFATHFEFFPENLATVFWAHVFGDGANATYNPVHGMFWESWLYVGVVPALAALVALVTAFVRLATRRPRLLGAVAFWGLLGALAFSLMLGKHSTLFVAAFPFVPGLGLFRFPQRFALVLELGVALLGAFGVDVLVRRMRALGRRAALSLGGLLLALTSADLVYIMARHFPAVPGHYADEPPVAAKRMRADAPTASWRYAVVFAPEAHVEAFGAARAWTNLRPYVDHRELLQPDSNLLWDVESIAGHGSLLPYDVGLVLASQSIVGTVIGPRGFYERPAPCEPEGKRPARWSGKCTRRLHCTRGFARALGALDVRYLLSPIEAADCPGFTFMERIDAGRFAVWLYRNDAWLGRAFVVGEARDVETSERGARTLISASFDPVATVLRTRAPDTQAGGPGEPSGKPPARPRRGDRRDDPRDDEAESEPAGECAYRRDGPDRASIACRARKDGFVVIADTHYPGQRVELDGEPVEPFVANVIGLGIPVSAGEHRLVVEYRPSWRWLVPLAFAGWGLLLALAAPAIARAIRRLRD